jgi:hypothetical protein
LARRQANSQRNATMRATESLEEQPGAHLACFGNAAMRAQLSREISIKPIYVRNYACCEYQGLPRQANSGDVALQQVREGGYASVVQAANTAQLCVLQKVRRRIGAPPS